ncbi:MAG: hypothetical protein IPN14_04065 [Bacteroidetes bacterium]|nr:hypothetical protein [Bacteroidota bacterium]
MKKNNIVQQQFGKMAGSVLNSTAVLRLNICAKLNICASISATSPSCKTLPASLTYDSATMNDRIKHKQLKGQMNHQTADTKANASVFLFFTTAHFLKTILASRTNGTFGFARHTQSQPCGKSKRAFYLHSLNFLLNLLPLKILFK